MFQTQQARSLDGTAGSGADRMATAGRRTLTEELAPAQLSPVQRKAGESVAPETAAAPHLPRLDLVQRKAEGAPSVLESLGGGAGGAPEQALPADGGGRPLPAGVRAKMEAAFGADFSAVRVHEGARASALGARAYAQGADLHFAPGTYDPDSAAGQELLGHELAHVVQQRQGRVQATTQAKGVGVNDDSSLEREADEMGARAARGESTGATGGAGGGAGAASGAVQRAPIQRIKIGIDDVETTDRQNRARVLEILRTAGPLQLDDILRRMEQENHPNNIEYIQILHKELTRGSHLGNIDQITRQSGGVWTSASIFYEKQFWGSTPPVRAGNHGEIDGYGVGMSDDDESQVSVQDSEVATIVAVENQLKQLLGNHGTGAHMGRRVDILITGNMGPCDGCKDRLYRFIQTCRERWFGVNFELEVNYTTQPNDVVRKQQDTTYGHHGDGHRVSTSGIGYHHHNY